jgi:RsiW-degrading membrane proteinase PrsW (M82 family)
MEILLNGLKCFGIMFEVIYLIILGFITLALLVGLFWYKRKGDLGDKNYKGLFIMGITFLPVGIVLSISTSNPGLIGISGVGAAYLVIALKNRDKWGQNPRK